MSNKRIDNSTIVHRPKRRRNYVFEVSTEQQSQNLKTLHQTLLCEDPVRTRQPLPDRSSAAQILSNNRSYIRRQEVNESQSKDKLNKPVNFYINIEKLRNLKIGSKEKPSQKVKSSALLNPYLRKEKNSLDRRSGVFRNEEAYRKINASLHDKKKMNAYGSIGSIERITSEHQEHYRHSKGRYRTEMNHASLPKKQTAFKRANNEVVLKDKNFIEGYLKGKQLGRGGFSKVWEAFNFKTKKFYAVKQIDTNNKYQTHLTEIWFGNHFFENGQPKKDHLSHPGVNSLLRMYGYSIVDPRAFIVFESCNGSLGNMLYDIYEEDREDEVAEDDKLYMIKYKPLYAQLKRDTTFLRTMLTQISEALDLLGLSRIVHSDIKTENILLKGNEEQAHFQFKLIDYGSSFVFESLKQYKLATPEYMCPELLNYILFENKKPHREEMLSYVQSYNNISAIDVWGLGCIVLELIHGLPLWLSNKTKLLINGKYENKRGLFAVHDRSFSKILDRQLNVVDNFDAFIRKENNSGIVLDEVLIAVLKGMLNPDPSLRIRPSEIISALEAG